MESRELCTYIERFRSARKVSQENLVSGIVSIRQYRRYLNGESDMPFHIFVQMVDKLGLKTESVLREMEAVRFEEFAFVNKLYNYAVNYNYDKFNALLKENKNITFVDKINKLFFEFSIFIKEYYQNQLDNKLASAKISQLLNYPQILKHDIITDIELLILSFLMDVSGKVDQKKIVDKIFYFFNNGDKIIGGGNVRILILIIAKFAKIFGIREDYELVLEFCEIGLKRNLAIQSYYISEYLYYYQSLAYYKLERMEDFEIALQKCFNVLELDGNPSKIKKFESLIDEDYEIEFRKHVLERYYQEVNKKSEN